MLGMPEHRIRETFKMPVRMGAMSGQKIPAIAYLRTSSAANVGADKDSEPRQREAIQAYADKAGFEIVAEFCDAAVRGADAIDVRPGFQAMLEKIAGNGVRTIIVETASRFARDLMVQEVGYERLRAAKITLIAADSPSSFVEDTPTARLIRQVLGAVSEFEKAMLVAKLRGARDRKRALTGKKVGGRQSHAEMHPETVALAKRLRRASPITHKRLSLRKIGTALAVEGHLNEAGKPYSAAAVKSMLEGPQKS
jgi:DNA invertase Pin-like site-specific DNA recombinase